MARRPMPRPAAALQPDARDLLLRTWPGRVFMIAAALKFIFAIWRVLITGERPFGVGVVRGAATIALFAAVLIFGWRLSVQMKRQLLWRVRRKLILSHIFYRVTPSA